MKRIILQIVLLFNAIILLSQELSLERCFELAIANHITISEAEYKVEAARLDHRSQQFDRLPSLSLGTSLYTSGNAVDPTNNSFVSSAFLGQSIFLNSDYTILDWGQDKLERQLAKDQVLETQYSTSVAVNDIRNEVISHYGKILSLNNSIEILALSISESEEHINSVKELVKKGRKRKSDLMELEIQLLNEQLEYAGIRNESERQQSKFKNLIGLSNKSSLRLKSNIDYGSSEALSLTRDSLVKSNPRFKSSINRREQVSKKIEITKKSRLPKVTISANVGSNFSSLATQFNQGDSRIIYDNYFLNGEQILLGREVQLFQTSKTPYLSQIRDNIFYSFSVGATYPIIRNNKYATQMQKLVLEKEHNVKVTNQIEQELRLRYDDMLLELEKIQTGLTLDKAILARVKDLYQLKYTEFKMGKINAREFKMAKQELVRKKIQIKDRSIKLFLHLKAIELL